eukprot:1387192-Prymnesium_polylepis.1
MASCAPTVADGLERWVVTPALPRLSLIRGGFLAAAARCADRNWSESDLYERSSSSSAVITHNCCR